ncbi:uncharacterized protein LOC118196690 [Stegodyphus dumicola]|uniref:uncharacterized protein LOC118196690 n=1 Tax=Stegodyphus dumicola TaxID=202533 RepID=UPI0015AF7F00|nr:uncharacterized protein LOC118196690 [Stegodyphus dumicola]
MSYLGKGRKQDLINLSVELGLEVPPNAKIQDLKNLIVQSPQYDEKFVEATLESIIEARIEQHRLEEAEERKLEREREREFELERLRLTNANNGRENSQNNIPRSMRDLQNLMQRYNPESSDISLYLAMFERQARKAKVEEGDWVSHLMALLPMDIVSIILREPEQELDNYSYVKKILLQRFKLNPEAFRVKFVQHQRRAGSLYKDFAFELKNYLDEWLNGVDVRDFDALKDLMLTDQIKRRVNSEIREHFVDEWPSIISSAELVKKLDEYEAVRKSVKKPTGFTKNTEQDSNIKERKKGEFSDRVRRHDNVSKEKTAEKWKSSVFEKRRIPRCYECNSDSHLRPQCPRLKRQEAAEETVNKLGTSESPDTWLAPYMSIARVNNREMPVLRDTGSTIDLIGWDQVTHQMLLGETVWVKQPLDLHPWCLPLARIELEGEDFGKVITKAAVISSDLNQEYYLLGNRTARLIEQNKMQPHKINAVMTRSQTKACSRKENSPSQGPENNEVERPAGRMNDEEEGEISPVRRVSAGCAEGENHLPPPVE